MAEVRVRVVDTDPMQLGADALVVGVFREGIEAPATEAALEAVGLSDVPRDAGFEGKLGQTLGIGAPGMPFGRLLFVGLGDPDRLTDESLRRAGGSAARALMESCRRVGVTLPLVHPAPEAVRAVAEGCLLGAYRYDEQRSSPRPNRLRELVLTVPSRLVRPGRDAVKLGAIHARATATARDLVNLPPADKRPPQLADRIARLCADACEVEVWDERRLEAERCGGMLAVGSGSAAPPRMVLLRYRPAEPLARVALVGKGITFDSGGLSLKRPWTNMVHMKSDMGGVAAVAAACSVLADLDSRVEVVGICCLAENLPSGSAQRPGDVIRARNGKTVEVLNTDAEGRLAMMDGLSYAAELADLDAVVDVATLTGHVRYAVGAEGIGAFSDDDDLLRQLLSAAEEAGEPTWALPVWDDLREQLDSDVADLNNLGHGDPAGATIAALFLREFAGDRPWAHLDIAGAAWRDGDARWHLPKQGTGASVRLLLRWLERAHP